MKKNWSLTQEAFDRLLAWLGAGPEEAGRRYEEIRRPSSKSHCRSHEPMTGRRDITAWRHLPPRGRLHGRAALYSTALPTSSAGSIFAGARAARAPAPPPSEDYEREYECSSLRRRPPPDAPQLVLVYARRGAKIATAKTWRATGIALPRWDRAHRIRLASEVRGVRRGRLPVKWKGAKRQSIRSAFGGGHHGNTWR